MNAPVLIPLPARKEASGAPEVTRYVPRPGRTPPARLQVVPEPQECTVYALPDAGALTWNDILRMRGELPAAPAPKARRGCGSHKARPTKERAPFVPPYLRPNYWKGEVLLGADLHEHIRWTELGGKEAHIRACPPSLARLLATPEWRGSTTTDPTEAEIARLEASARASIKLAEDMGKTSKGKAAKARAARLEEAHRERLANVRQAIRVVHPSGAVLVWLPL